jgi:hypothetical protein
VRQRRWRWAGFAYALGDVIKWRSRGQVSASISLGLGFELVCFEEVFFGEALHRILPHMHPSVHVWFTAEIP